MSLASRVMWISLSGFLWSAACANEMPGMAGDKAEAGSSAPPVVGSGTAGSASAPAANKPSSAPATTPASTGSTSQPAGNTKPPAANSGGAGAAGAGGSATPAKPAASSGGAGAAGSVAAPATPAMPAGGSPAPAAGSGGVAGAEALPDLGEILPPLSTPETRVPSPNNPAECPATAPENPVGDCLGLPVYLECSYGTYFCICDWYHWLCAG